MHSDDELRNLCFTGLGSNISRLGKNDFNPNLYPLAFEWIKNEENRYTLKYKGVRSLSHTYEMGLWILTEKQEFVCQKGINNNIFFVIPSLGMGYIDMPSKGVVNICTTKYMTNENLSPLEYGYCAIYEPTDILFLNTNPDYIEIRENIELAEQIKKRDDEERKEIQKIKRQLLKKKHLEDLRKMALKELIDEGILFPNANERPPIPKDVANAVWNRDGGKCVYCGSTENLQFDHIIPFSKGGATTVENLQILCQKCNLKKSNKIG